MAKIIFYAPSTGMKSIIRESHSSSLTGFPKEVAPTPNLIFKKINGTYTKKYVKAGKKRVCKYILSEYFGL